MDGSNEHQGHLELLQLPDSQLWEMLERQERLQASGILDRLPDGGAKARALTEKLQDLLKQRKNAHQPSTQPIEDRSPQIRRFLPCRRPPPTSPLAPPPLPPPPKSPENAQVEELSQAVAALNIADPKGPESLDPPDLAQTQWDSLRARLAPSRPRPLLPRQQLPPAARLALLDLLPDPCQPSRLLQAAALPLEASAEPQVLFCLPAFLSAATSKQTGLSLRPEGTLWLQEDGRNREVVVEAEEEALRTAWRTMEGEESGERDIVVLLLIPGVPGRKAELLSLLGKAAKTEPERGRRLLLELDCTEWKKQISSLLSRLPRPLSCTQRLRAVRDFLAEDPRRLSPVRLAEAGRVVRLEDRLALSDWLRDRAQRLTAFRRRLPTNAGLLSPQEAEKIATEGWDFESLFRAAAAGWEGFACALLGPWNEQPVAEERVMLARRLFRRLRAKFERVEQHREALLPRNEPLVALMTQGGLPKRETCPLTLRESMTLTQQMQQREAKKTHAASSQYSQPQFKERREQMEDGDDVEEEEEVEGYEDESSSNDGEKGDRLSDAD